MGFGSSFDGASFDFILCCFDQNLVHNLQTIQLILSTDL